MNCYTRRVLKKNMQKWAPESSPRPPFNLVNSPKYNQCTQETLLLYILKEDYQKSLKNFFLVLGPISYGYYYAKQGD